MRKDLFNRRDFVRFFASGSVGIGLVAGGFGVNRLVAPVWEQYQTWQDTHCDAATFLQKYKEPLSHIYFGANLCPDYLLMAAKADPDRAVKFLKDYFGCQHVRFGMWWSTHVEQGLDAYDRWIEALLKQGMKIVLGYGLKAPFPPETHFPKAIKAKLTELGATPGSTISVNSPLGRMAIEYTQGVLEHLDAEFGLDSFDGFNPENEFDAPYGKLRLASGEDLLRRQAELLYTPNRRRRILLNTALISLPGYPASLTTVIKNALAIRQEFPTLDPIIGADIYEETGFGRVNANLYVDTFAGVRMRHGNALIPNARRTMAEQQIGFEVAEFQISDWNVEPREIQPGTRLHTQYLLARMAQYFINDPPVPLQEPMLVRLWEMSPILLNMLQDEHFFYANDDYTLIQRINQGL